MQMTSVMMDRPMHIIPRFKNDGQKIGWIPGKPSGEELEEVRKEIVGE